MSEQVRRRIVVRGRVQGVGFRYSTLQAARRLGVVGWVRNRPDGSVLCEAQGPPDRVDALIEELRRGPPGARVDAVSITDLEPVHPAENGFFVAR